MATDDLKDWRPHAAKMRADLCGQLPNGVGNTIDALIEQIATLEAQLAARPLHCECVFGEQAVRVDERGRVEAEIAAWLRAQYNGRLQSPVYMADAIERGHYAKGQTDAQQGD